MQGAVSIAGKGVLYWLWHVDRKKGNKAKFYLTDVMLLWSGRWKPKNILKVKVCRRC